MPEIKIKTSFAVDSRKIEVDMDPFMVIADGGDRTEPSPGALFIAGVLACTASTARGYCLRNKLPSPTGMEVKVNVDEETRLVDIVAMSVLVPPDFPEDRLDALHKAAGACTVKKWWQHLPEFVLDVNRLN